MLLCCYAVKELLYLKYEFDIVTGWNQVPFH